MELFIDPSFTRTGVCLVDKDKFYFKSFSSKIGDKSYVNILKASEDISNRINNWLKSDFNKNSVSVLCIEHPAPIARVSSMMTVLFTYLVLSIHSHKVYLINPSYINVKIFKKRSVKKSEIFKYVKDLGLSVTNHDEASSYLLYELYKNNLCLLWE